MPGGYVLTEAAPGGAPVVLPYAYKHIPESATRCVWLDIPFTCKADEELEINVYVKATSAPSGMAEGPRVQLIDPDYAFNHASSLLVDTPIADNTNWQTINVSYTPTTSRELRLRVRGADATDTEYFHWMFVPVKGLGGGGLLGAILKSGGKQ